jgi:23S rRNA G2069 N7-methylase RlmK/C1962 C5-methylase RlmI
MGCQHLKVMEEKVCRFFNAESDGLPDIIVEGYADFPICQDRSIPASC